MSYSRAQLRRMVTERAFGRCEYCLYPSASAYFSFEMEHIIAEKHGGKAVLDNLALACPPCNRFKGSDLGSLDPETGTLTPFYNPRTHAWRENFGMEKGLLVPKTAVARVTVSILRLNDPERVRERLELMAAGLYGE